MVLVRFLHKGYPGTVDTRLGSFFAVGIVLCVTGCQAVLVCRSTRYPPICDSQQCLQVLPHVPWRGNVSPG